MIKTTVRGCQMAPYVHVSTCTHLDINNMDIIYHTTNKIELVILNLISRGALGVPGNLVPGAVVGKHSNSNKRMS